MPPGCRGSPRARPRGRTRAARSEGLPPAASRGRGWSGRAHRRGRAVAPIRLDRCLDRGGKRAAAAFALKILIASRLFPAMDERARALERLYRERYTAFRNGLATITGSSESARDAVQEAFARALRR